MIGARPKATMVKEAAMILRWILAPTVIALMLGVVAPATACCDWTPQDTAFWQEMSENPRTFSFEMDARPSSHKLNLNGRDLRVPADPDRARAYWHDLYHALQGDHAPMDHKAGASTGKTPRQ